MRSPIGRLAAALVAVVIAFGCVSCSSSSSKSTPASSSPLQVGMIHAAISALETKLGGPQQYFEVNATPTLVNLFVATDNATKAVAYIYAGTLQDPAPAVTASGNTFAASAIDFDPKTVLAKVIKQLPTSQFLTFAINGAPSGPPRYTVTVQSLQGGELEISLQADGTIILAEEP